MFLPVRSRRMALDSVCVGLGTVRVAYIDQLPGRSSYRLIPMAPLFAARDETPLGTLTEYAPRTRS